MKKSPEFIQRTRCPFCRKLNDFASPMFSEHAPKDGDVSLCVGCGEWAFFDAKAKAGLRKPTFAEYEDIVANPECQKVRFAWHLMSTQKQETRF